jgi:iron-sulfur cluster protein
MSGERAATADHIRAVLAEEGDAVGENTRGFNQGRYDAVADLEDYEGLKAEARAIKEDAIANLPDLIAQVEASVEAAGGHVHLAGDAADANEYIRAVAADAGAETAVKSKSMTSEEIAVNDALDADGVDVVETDLGEFVLQVADEEPSHIVAPAIHRTREEIADLFNTHFDPDEPLETAAELTRFAREHLGERVAEADLGMTGANFVAADSGTIALVTSEGNARKTVEGTDVHVAVAGVEKLIPSVSELGPFVELIARSGTGQDLTSYLSLLGPDSASPTMAFGDDDASLSERDADREFHLVLLDNGRMAMREDDHLRETLYCIRCGACSNSCANFQAVGGHAFGGETYSGGIATGWEAGVHGEDAAGEFNDLCTGCSRCVNQCPVNIDIPWINTVVRDRINRGADAGSFDHLVSGLTPDAEPDGLDLQKRFFGNFETVARLGSATAPVSNWLARRGPTRWLADSLLGVDPRRELPAFRRETLVDWFAARGARVAPADATREAVVYPDVYTNYVDPDRGKAAIRTLEALGVHVRVPALPDVGRAPLSQGMVATAEAAAADVADALAPPLDAGRDVVVVEPSDLAMLRDDYANLLAEEAFERLADNSFEAVEYVHGLLENGADADALADLAGEQVAYHGHCQQRTLGLAAHTAHVLAAAGADVVTSDVECCGMAGSFGYKSQYYDLSVDVGEQLVAQFEGLTDHRLAASGTSCAAQLSDLLGREVVHPVELLAPA